MKVHEHSFCPECGQALEGSEYLCPSCAFKLAEPPVEQTPPPVNENVPPPPPVNEEPPVENPEPPKAEDPVPPVEEPKEENPVPPIEEPQQDPVFDNAEVEQQGIFDQSTPPPAVPMQKKSKLWLWIVLIVVGFLIVAAAVGSFLIYNGTIPKNKVDFLPKSVLEILTPKSNNSGPVENKPDRVYYLAYSFTLIEDTNEKVIIISSVMDPGSVDQANEFGAKSSFNEFAKINYPDDYFLFKNVKVKKFNSREDAVNERESIKKDFKSKGYTLRLMEVVYSIK
ncbi:MAG: hypothetical protein C0592_14035 [Marinilabiliales bacterium]|nr:MAG: hypothetical protein C0592_14035 [Marinilabiliales bacterium]